MIVYSSILGNGNGCLNAVNICGNVLLVLCCLRNNDGFTWILNDVRDADVLVSSILIYFNFRIALVCAKNNCISAVSDDSIEELVTLGDGVVSVILVGYNTANSGLKCVGNYDNIVLCNLLVRESGLDAVCVFLAEFVRILSIENCLNDSLLEILLCIGRGGGGCCVCGCGHSVVVNISYLITNLVSAVVVIFYYVAYAADKAGFLLVISVAVEGGKQCVVDFINNDCLTVLFGSEVFFVDLDCMKRLKECIIINSCVIREACLLSECVICASCEGSKNCYEEKNCCNNSLFHCGSFLFL